MDGPSFDIPANWTFEDKGVADGFDRHVREQLPWYELATGAVAHVARHYIPLDGVVYDLGAATGNIGRTLAPTLQARKAMLIAVEPSAEMAAAYRGPQRSNLQVERAERVAFQPFDVAIAFLTLMFVAVAERAPLLDRMLAALKPGGALIVFDKCEADFGYAATVIWRLALAGKLATGVEPSEIVAKELSLSGVQRPLSRAVLPAHALEFFRFGEFAGWLIEKETPRCRQDPWPPRIAAGSIYTNRADAPTTRSDVLQASSLTPAAPIAAPPPAHQGRGNAALMLADRIAAQSRAATVTREDVTPELEPDNPSLTTDEPGEDFTDNEDVTDELEPFDPTIESAAAAPEQRVTVEGDETEVTITAEEGETIVAVTEDEHGNVEVEVEDTADVLL